MQSTAIVRQQPVLSLNQEEFDAVCADLMLTVGKDGKPDLVIGIPTGGAWVAAAMTNAMTSAIPVLQLTCRRPSSRMKTGSAVKSVVAMLPRPVVDRLRQVEHALLTRGEAKAPAVAYDFVADELSQIAGWIAGAGRPLSLLVVDDAVDSGATLLQVTRALHKMAPPGTTIRTAAVTVTTNRPLIQPDYAMFRRQLCRFPWSLDAH